MNPLSRSRNGRVWATCAFLLTALFAIVGLTPHGVQTAYAASSITLAGSLQSELGCAGDWDPACAATHLTSVGNDVWRGEFTLPAGDYAYKMVVDNDWGNGNYPGADKPLSLGAETTVRFYFDEKTNGVVDSVNDAVAVAAGSFQSELGCADDWQPWCTQSLLTDADGDGVYSFAMTGLPAGSYAFKVALNEGWDTAYPAGDVPFTTTAEDDVVTITWDSATTDVTVDVSGAPSGPGYTVALVGNLQDELGCPGDWQPECAATEMTYDAQYDIWRATFTVPSGNYEYKVALNDTWDVSYGAGAQLGGDNIPLAADGEVTFYYDPNSNWITDNVNSVIATAAGSFQSELGCADDWQPWCLHTWMQDIDGDGVYTFTTDQLPAGSYEAKAALNEAWDVSYGAGGGGDNVPFVITELGDTVTISYDTADNNVTATVTPIGGGGGGGGGVEIPPEIAALVNAPARNPIQDDVFYFVMPDRFANGDPSNDTGGIAGGRLDHGFDPTDKGFFHGGDLNGMTAKLDYLAEMGITSIWMTPVFKNQPVQGSGDDISAGYHGYWYVDMTQFDPHFGTNEELETLIEEAHARGIKVFFDIITNHTADIITYEEGTFDYVSKANAPYLDENGVAFDDREFAFGGDFPTLDPAISFPYTPTFTDPAHATLKVPAWLNDPQYYHNRGNSTFSGENSLYGDFFGLDDLFTEHPDVVNGMIDIYKFWITNYDIDGFRVDTVKHVNIEFWQQFTPAILEHAADEGKPDFFIFGEVFSGNQELLSYYTSRSEFPAVLDFAFQEQVRNYVSGNNGSDAMRDLFAKDDYYTDADSNAYALPTFIGNHDRGRFAHFLDVDNGVLSDDEKLARIQLAHAMMYFSRGVPVVYYGDEQGFVGDGDDKDARQNMFPSQVASYNDDDLVGTDATTADDNFDPTHPLYLSFADYAEIYQAHQALRTGAQLHRYSQSTAGIYAFSRIDRDEQVEYVLAFNNAGSEQTASFGTDSPNTSFTAVYPPDAAAVNSDGDGQLSVTVPAFGFVVYRADAGLPASDAAPAVSFNTLSNDQEITLGTQNLDGNDVQDRIEVGVALGDDSFAEVTFAVRETGAADYTVIGVDDNAPYRVFMPLENVAEWSEGDTLEFVAIVTDHSGNMSYATVSGIAPVIQSDDNSGGGGASGDVPYAIVHYYREDGDYGDHTTGDYNDFWGLHLWGDAITADEVTDWPAPKPFLGEDEYGRFAWIALQDASQNVNFIVHRGDAKDGTDADRSFNPSTDGAEIWLKQGDGNFYTSQAAAQGYVTIRYYREDGDYGDPSSDNYEDFWGLHLWGDAIDPTEATDWPAPKKPTGFDDYGAYWEVAIQNAAEPVNFIIHRGDAKDPGPDQSFTPADSATVWIQSGDETLYTSRGAAEDFATIHYHRADGDYGDYTSDDYNDFWGLHIWEGAASPNPAWQEPVKPAGFDIYGPYFEIPLVDGAPQLAYILHRGDEKDPGPDQFLVVNTWGYEVWQLEGEGPVADQPHYVLPTLGEPGPNPGNLTQQRAYWVDETTIAWDVPVSLSNSYQLHYAAAGGLETTEAGLANSDGSLTLTPSVLSDAVKAKFPHLADLPAFAIDAADVDMVPAVLKGQIAVSAVDGDGVSIDATGLQIPGVLDDLYTYNGELGVSWDDNGVPTIRVWAPTAQNVTFHLFADSDPATTSTTTPMEYDPVSGVWSIIGDASWKDQYYLYEVAVYVNSTGQVENNIVTDPYSFSLSMNSARSQIVDLRDADLKPAGWDNIAKPELVAPEDISIYEIHVRDFSIYDETVAEADRGTFKAFTYSDSAGMLHLKALADAGLSHLHFLPVFDIATINEDKSAQVNPDPDVLDDFAPDSDQQQAAIAAVGDQDGFNWGYDPYHYTVPEGSYSTNPDGTTRIVEFREMVQTVNDSGMRVVMDVVYNHTNASGQNEKSVLDKIVPGYYHRLNDVGVVEKSTCCDNTASEHAMFEKLMIDSLVTWAIEYKVDAFRFDLMGHHMVSNMLNVRAALDALTLEEHGVDGKSIYLYGEGWNFGEVANNARGVNATQLNLAGTGIGTFSDRMRDAIRGGGCCPDAVGLFAQGFGNGLYTDPNSYDTRSAEDQKNELLLMSDQVRVEMAGGLATYQLIDRNGNIVTGAEVPYGGGPAGYVADPQEIISYVSKHDNQTLYDINAYGLPADTPMAERIRAQAVGLSTVMYGQGIPFFHAGVDLLRSKSLDRDSYNSGDWFNRLDFTYQTNNFGVGLPIAEKNQSNWQYMSGLLADSALRAGYEDITRMNAMFREMLAVRNSSKLFRLETAADIQERVVFHNTGPNQLPGLIVMTVSDMVGADLDPLHKQIVVLINTNDEAQSFAVTDLVNSEMVLHPVLMDSVDDVVKTTNFDSSTGVFTVPGRTSAVFVELQDGIDPPPPTGPAVVSFTLIDPATDQPVAGFDPIPADAVLNLADLPTDRYNIRANVDGEGIESVVFSGSFNRTENVAPYALFGDKRGDYRQRPLKEGAYSVTATPYSEDRGRGEAGTALTLNFTVVDNPAPPAFEVVSFTLIDAETDQPIAGYEGLSVDTQIDLSEIGATRFNIRADINGEGVESVVFSGSFSRTENVDPYALFGDRNGDYYGRDLAAGSYTVTATPYSKNRGKGAAGTPLTIELTVVE